MKMYDYFKTLPLLWLVVAGLNPAIANSLYSPAQISQDGQAWLTDYVNDSTVKVAVYPLDNRLAERSCTEPLQFSLVNPKIQTQNSIRVLCNGPAGWQLYLSAKVSRLIEVAVSERQLPSGTVLSQDMFRLEMRDQLTSRGSVIQDPQLLSGARSKRSLSVGQVVTLQDLCLVCKGDMVTIEGISGTLIVATAGRALADGSLGENIQVQNLNSGRTVQASVTAVKKVAIEL